MTGGVWAAWAASGQLRIFAELHHTPPPPPQVVRADLGELWHMDLHGAPYGYTPFCDSREETLGYQFWRHGYWKDHLAGRPYHISALYVVDLLAFRRAAVGDQLRAIYDTLSRDPNSLSNLDQDLPNYAQTHIPIHSLPQEWLWCESWCSDESKGASKTIGEWGGGLGGGGWWEEGW